MSNRLFRPDYGGYYFAKGDLACYGRLQCLLSSSYMCLSAGGSIWSRERIYQAERFIFKGFQENAQGRAFTRAWRSRIIGGRTDKTDAGLE